MHQIGGVEEADEVGSMLSRKSVERNSGAREGQSGGVYIPLGDVRVSTYKAVERCAIDAAFFTFLDGATFCEFRPRMPDETPPPPEGSI